MRWISFLAVATAFFVALLGSSFSAQAGGNCQSKLVGKSYDCELVAESGGGPLSECLEFATGGLSGDFDLLFRAGADYGCACNSAGSANSPSFDSSSKSFECLDTNNGFLLNGTIKGKKLAVQGTSEAGDSVVMTCTLRSTPCP